MTSIIQDMRYRLSLIKYAKKYGVTKVAVKYKTNSIFTTGNAVTMVLIELLRDPSSSS